MKILAICRQWLGQELSTRTRLLWLALFVLLAVVVLIAASGPTQGQTLAGLVVYDDALATGWQDYQHSCEKKALDLGGHISCRSCGCRAVNVPRVGMEQSNQLSAPGQAGTDTRTSGARSSAYHSRMGLR